MAQNPTLTAEAPQVTEGQKRYAAYLASAHWAKLRGVKLLSAGNRCERCQDTRWLEVHHTDYRNLYDCSTIDLEVLCKFCHKRKHFRPWPAEWRPDWKVSLCRKKLYRDNNATPPYFPPAPKPQKPRRVTLPNGRTFIAKRKKAKWVTYTPSYNKHSTPITTAEYDSGLNRPDVRRTSGIAPDLRNKASLGKGIASRTPKSAPVGHSPNAEVDRPRGDMGKPMSSDKSATPVCDSSGDADPTIRTPNVIGNGFVNG